MTEIEIPEGFRHERWTFAGEDTSNGKRVARFIDASNTTWPLAWKKEHASLATGYLYEVLASDTAVRGGYTFTGDKADNFDEVRMQDRARATARETVRMQDKARRGDEDLAELLDSIEAYAARFTKISSREALVSLITRSVYRAKR